MILFSINLPSKYRFDVKLTKKRKITDKPLIPPLGKVLRAKAGSKFSRFFRLIFENERVKKVFGLNIALFVVVSTLMPKGNIEVYGIGQDTLSTPIVLTTQNGIQYPVKTVRITQGYRFYHPGIDLDGVTGDPVYPILTGSVESTGYSRFGYGNNIIINHGNGLTSMYAHLSKMNVVAGQKVNKETVIGEIGATGRAFGDHLHLEIYQDGKPTNPLSIIR